MSSDDDDDEDDDDDDDDDGADINVDINVDDDKKCDGPMVPHHQHMCIVLLYIEKITPLHNSDPPGLVYNTYICGLCAFFVVMFLFAGNPRH